MNNLSTTKLPFPVEPGHDRHPVAGWLMSAAGHSGMYVIGFGSIVVFGVAGELWGEIVGLLFFVIAIAILSFLLPTMIGLIARGRRLRALPADELLRREERAPVVLLRSFNDDDLIDPTFTTTYKVVPGRYEDRLVEALAPLGPAIALGRPEEKEPQLGAARMYVKDEYWQHAITYLMERSTVVLAVVGGTPGLWWEIEFAIQQTPVERLLFFFPYPAPPRMRRSYWRAAFFQHQIWGRFIRRRLFSSMDTERQARYKAFRERVNNLLPRPLPEALGDVRFIAFSQDGQPVLINPAKPSIWTRVMTINLNPKMDIPFKRELQPFVAKRLKQQAG